MFCVGNFVVLIGDIDGSRKLSPQRRYEVQDAFIAFVESLNASYKTLTLPAVVSCGDSFIVILQDTALVRKIMNDTGAFSRSIGISFSFGLGQGEIYCYEESAATVSGDGYWRANRSLKRAKEAKKRRKR